MPIRLAVISVVVLGVAVAAPGSLTGQIRVLENDRWCEDSHYRDRDSERYCHVREVTLAAEREVIRVDGRTNGGIEVRGWDRNEILLRAKVQGHADEVSEARALVEAVELELGSTIEADGPRRDRHEWWSVSYELFVPKESNLSLRTLNGGIRISDVSGDMSFRATNGGIRLNNVGGDVRGSTTNGGLRITLTGNEWEGRGLDVETTNGGVVLNIPEDYSAIVESGTVNGGLEVDFPVTLQGRIDRRHLTLELGEGGRTIRATTTNGGVVIRRT